MDVQNAIDIMQLAILQQLQMEVEFEDQRTHRRPQSLSEAIADNGGHHLIFQLSEDAASHV